MISNILVRMDGASSCLLIRMNAFDLCERGEFCFWFKSVMVSFSLKIRILGKFRFAASSKIRKKVKKTENMRDKQQNTHSNTIFLPFSFFYKNTFVTYQNDRPSNQDKASTP